MSSINKMEINNMRAFINNIFSKIESFFSLPRLKLLKTLYVNIRMLPLGQALKFPIYVYGMRIYSLKGNMVINGKIERGMIKFGLPRYGHCIDHRKIYLYLAGDIIFNGPCAFANGTSLNIAGTLEMGQDSYISENVYVTCANYIKIGGRTIVGPKVTFMDTDSHSLYDMNNGKINRSIAPINIGRFCWIGSGAVVLKGTILPDSVTVASNSLLNKDYLPLVPQKSVIGGLPAKLIKEGVVRVRKQYDRKYRDYFLENESEKYAYIDKNADYHDICYPDPMITK